MNYIECTFKLNPYAPFNEILIAELAEFEFESFLEEEPVVKAYIPISQFDAKVVEELSLLNSDQLKIDWSYTEIEQENWNKKWESSFDAIDIASFCTIRAPFHPYREGFKHEIIIEPKMSFGTGHHATTQLMIEEMEKLDFKGKTVLDMGSGTAILSILAEKLGADVIHAIDIDEWAYDNMKENIERNNCENIKTRIGDVEVLEELNSTYDYIIANINKNVLFAQFEQYAKRLKSGGELLISGFYDYDINDFQPLIDKFNLYKINEAVKNKWSLIRCKKD